MAKARKGGEQASFDFGASAPTRREEPSALDGSETPGGGSESAPADTAEPSSSAPAPPSARAPRSTRGPSSSDVVVPPYPEAVVEPPSVLARPVAPEPVKPKAPEPLTVAGLGKLVERSLADKFEEPVVVVGEASGVRAAQSGHLYFTLKDEDADASIDVVVYRTNLTPRTRSLVRDGAKILLRGRPTYYSPRGRLQFVADRVGLSGKGALLEALEKLKEKLAAEGLFREAKKRKLPTEPRIVGVVTSRSGAVIHDICRVAFRRGGAHILLAPAIVQGPTAPEAIRRALADLQKVPEVDVIIVGRGGGSADDLSAFNDEALVRAVAACRVPVVSAVGHEVDVTLVDFAADARASTPSQAAELVVPDARSRVSLLAERRRGLLRAMRGHLSEGKLDLAALRRRLGDPRSLVANAQQRLDDRRMRATRAIRLHLDRQAKLARDLESRVAAKHPATVLATERASLATLRSRVATAAVKDLTKKRSDLARASARLEALSPLAVLGRGYAIVTDARGHAVRGAEEVAAGDRLDVRVAQGTFAAEVSAKRPAPSTEAAPKKKKA